VRYEGKDLLALAPEERAVAGIFLAFQYPVEIPGVGNLYFLRTALNALRQQRGLEAIDAIDFLVLAKERMKLVEMDPSFMKRSVNEGFSGGEKKRNEILQMTILEPKLAILDETDSGLDIDALRTVAAGVNALRSRDRAALLITHYQRLLDYIVPDRVHVMVNGRLVASAARSWRWNWKSAATRASSRRCPYLRSRQSAQGHERHGERLSPGRLTPSIQSQRPPSGLAEGAAPLGFRVGKRAWLPDWQRRVLEVHAGHTHPGDSFRASRAGGALCGVPR